MRILKKRLEGSERQVYLYDVIIVSEDELELIDEALRDYVDARDKELDDKMVAGGMVQTIEKDADTEERYPLIVADTEEFIDSLVERLKDIELDKSLRRF